MDDIRLEVLDIGLADIKALKFELVAGLSLFKSGMIKVINFNHIPRSIEAIAEVLIPLYDKGGVWVESIQIRPEEELVSGELFGLLSPATLKLLNKIAEKINDAGIKDAAFPVHPYIPLRLEKKINPFFGHMSHLSRGHTGLFPDNNIRGFRILDGEDNAVFISGDREIREIFLGEIHRRNWLPSSYSLWKSEKKINSLGRQAGNLLPLALKNGDSLRINIPLLRELKREKKWKKRLLSFLGRRKPVEKIIGRPKVTNYVGQCHFCKGVEAAVSQNGTKIYLFPSSL